MKIGLTGSTLRLCCSLAATNSTALAQQISPSTPMVDGICEEYVELGVATTELEFGVVLYQFQNSDYVWFCYTKNEDSWGVLDLYIDAPALEEPLNLHVSAQLREYPAFSEGRPNERDDPSWEISGWWSNVGKFNGRIETEDGFRINFKRSPAREIQLSKNRFGRGEWQLHFRIDDIVTETGNHSLDYPKNENSENDVLIINTDR